MWDEWRWIRFLVFKCFSISGQTGAGDEKWKPLQWNVLKYFGLRRKYSMRLQALVWHQYTSTRPVWHQYSTGLAAVPGLVAPAVPEVFPDELRLTDSHSHDELVLGELFITFYKLLFYKWLCVKSLYITDHFTFVFLCKTQINPNQVLWALS